MFKVHHIFPSGEWAATEVDTLEEALMWFDCKAKSKNDSILTLYDPDGNIVKQIIGK